MILGLWEERATAVLVVAGTGTYSWHLALSPAFHMVTETQMKQFTTTPHGTYEAGWLKFPPSAGKSDHDGSRSALWL